MLGVGALVGVALFGRQLQALYDYAGSGPVTSPEPGLLFASLDQRVEIWSRAIDGIEDFPFTGMGLNTFRKLVFVLYPLSLEGPEVDLGHAHNIWLQVSLDLGLPGLVAYLAIWFSALAMLA